MVNELTSIMTKITNSDKSSSEVRPSTSKWIKHVHDYRQVHDVSFKVALKAAGATYTKVLKEKKLKEDHKENPWMVHIQQYKSANPQWKDTMSYKEVLQACKLTYKPSAQIIAPTE
jgi:hypothetical protein